MGKVDFSEQRIFQVNPEVGVGFLSVPFTAVSTAPKTMLGA